jgi:endonuclease III
MPTLTLTLRSNPAKARALRRLSPRVEMAARKADKKPAGKALIRRIAGAAVVSKAPAKAVKARAAAKAAASGKAATSKAAVLPKPVKRLKGASAAEALALYRLIRERHADAHCELDHRSPFELLIATVLSAQSTDVMVNKLTPELFRRWPGPRELAAAEPAEVEKALARIGMFRQKTKNILGLSKLLLERHGGQVPRTLAELVELPGVGRKTANVVLGVAFGQPEGVVVDTHVQRISQRLGLTLHAEPSEIEQDLMKLFDRTLWDPLSHTLIFHGRRICSAIKPACAACPAQERCPSAFNAEQIGRKRPRLR